MASSAAPVAISSAVAFGVEVPPPRVEAIHPFSESNLFGISIGDPDKLGLIGSDETGAFHHVVCRDGLCSVADAKQVLDACSDQRQCKIIGAVKHRTFYPLYLSDEVGQHACDPRWSS